MLPLSYSNAGLGFSVGTSTTTSREEQQRSSTIRPTLIFISQTEMEHLLSTYIEPDQVTRRLFARFDISRRGSFTMYDIRRVTLSLGLRPRDAELRAMVAEIRGQGSIYIQYKDFQLMRQARRGERLYGASLNVIAEFIKFNVSELHRGRITSEAVERALGQEGILPSDRLCRAYTAALMQCDSDGDGQVSFRDLYDAMTGRVPQAWMDWIYQEVHMGTPHTEVIKVLMENGFTQDVAKQIVERTASSSTPLNTRCFADTDVRHSYKIMV